MTTPDLEERLSASLHARAAALHDAPLTLDGVRRRAGSIRRRRRLAAGAGLAAAVALLVPVGILATGPVDRGQELPPASPAPSPVPLPEPVPLDAGAPQGSPAKVPWGEGTTLHLPGGGAVTTDVPYGDVHVVEGRVFATRTTEEGSRFLDELDADGDALTSVPFSGELVTNDDGTALAYRTGDSFGVLTRDGVLRSAPLPGDAGLVALTGDATCSDGCAVWFSGGSGSLGRVDLDGVRTEPVEALALRDVHDDRLVSALTEVDDLEPGSCSAVVEEGRPLWSTCDHTLGRFSPDASFVAATDAYLDGLGQHVQAILDARTGEQYVELDPGDDVIFQRAWEDDAHLLVTTYSEDDAMWRLFRAGVDGTVELLAAREAELDEGGPAFHLTESGAGVELP